MIYQSTVTTPANTTIKVPLKTTLKMIKGLIYQFELYFPPGSSGLCGVAVHDSNVQIYPRGRNEFFVGDNVVISFPDLYELLSENETLEIITYNLDTDYDHQIQTRFGIVSREDFKSAYLPALSFSSLSDSVDTLNKTIDAVISANPKKGFSLFNRREK